MSHEAPGKAYRDGVSLIDMMQMFSTEQDAIDWFESIIWPDGRYCPKCGSTNTVEAKHKTMPYWCNGCRGYFSVRTGTPIARSNVPLQKWAIAIYLTLTSLKSVSSMKLQRDLSVSQPTAWFMLHRLREAWSCGGENDDDFDGPVEVDESYFGGKRANMSNAKRKALREAGAGRGTDGKTAVAGIKDRDTNHIRAKVVRNVNADTMEDFIEEHVEIEAEVYTDDSRVYQGLLHDHETVQHSVSEYVRGKAHTNGIESFWAMLKRAHDGTFHKMSPKHLNRYVQEFAGKHNIRELDTLEQMRAVVARMVGKNLLYRNLVKCNGLSNAAH